MKEIIIVTIKIKFTQKKIYYAKNREKIKESARRYRELNADKIKERRKLNREKTSKLMTIYRHNNIQARIVNSLRSRIWCAIRGHNKSRRTMELLGCSIEYLRDYLENKFQEGMSWNNYGANGWHIDHIRPCASFDLSDPEQQKICFHYTNLQPLWAKDNIIKGAKY